MDPLSQYIKTHQNEDEDELPVFSSSPVFILPEANINYQSVQEIDPFSFPQVEFDRCYYQPSLDAEEHDVLVTPTPAVALPSEEEEAMKKKHHNASERMRRRKLNGLFASLSSMLPCTDDKMNKQTAPATVERVINYIPELRNEVESLTQRKQQLLISNPTPDDVVFATSTAQADDVVSAQSSTTSSWFVNAIEVENGEVSILISMVKTLVKTSIPISYVLRLLEEEDSVNVIGVSSSESDGRLFYHIHLHLEEEEGSHKIDSEWLRTKLLSSGRKWDDMCRWMMTQLNHVYA